MRQKIKWIFIVGGLGVLLAFSMLAPLAADEWTDRNTLGELAYEKVMYEPYEISYYNTFEDKLDAIVNCVSTGEMVQSIILEEGEEALDDDTLIQLANKELEELYENGLLPQKLSIREWEKRIFLQLYALPQSEGYVPLQDVCFWVLTAEMDDVWISFAMDSSFYKIYYFSVIAEEEELLPDTREWMERIINDNGRTLAESWCSYWQLEDAAVIDAEQWGSEKSITDIYEVSSFDADAVSGYNILSKNHYEIDLSYQMQNFAEYETVEGYFLITGMSVMR
jgi:hypothetical protein